MNTRESYSWYFTDRNESRGYINPHALRELWLHTGTACNLACPFCLEGSKPGDKRLQPITLQDVRPFIDEAVKLGTERISITGGEPFIVRDLPRILEYASLHCSCLVLSNGTRPLQKRLREIEFLHHAPCPVAFRISLDYPDAAWHDAGRGPGAFKQALQGLVMLYKLGFDISVARQGSPDEDAAAVAGSYRRIFREYGLPEDLPLIRFPDFHTPGQQVDTPAITEDCMIRHHTEDSRAGFMCAYSRMLVKLNGRMRVYACTLVDDDPDYDLGGTLSESLFTRVMLRHHRCYSCFKFGASCS
jgi:hypothetical protein